MSIYDFAIQMENEGAAFYRELAGKSPNPSVQSVLRMLAEEEDKHAAAVRAMAAEQPDAELETADVLANAKNIFRRVKEFGEPFVTETDQIHLYRQALELEEKSRAFYLDRADEVKGPKAKRLFERLADEEGKHAQLLENLIEAVSRPKQWLENAEFFHQEEY